MSTEECIWEAIRYHFDQLKHSSEWSHHIQTMLESEVIDAGDVTRIQAEKDMDRVSAWTLGLKTSSRVNAFKLL